MQIVVRNNKAFLLDYYEIPAHSNGIEYVYIDKDTSWNSFDEIHVLFSVNDDDVVYDTLLPTLSRTVYIPTEVLKAGTIHISLYGKKSGNVVKTTNIVDVKCLATLYGTGGDIPPLLPSNVKMIEFKVPEDTLSVVVEHNLLEMPRVIFCMVDEIDEPIAGTTLGGHYGYSTQYAIFANNLDLSYGAGTPFTNINEFNVTFNARSSAYPIRKEYTYRMMIFS